MRHFKFGFVWMLLGTINLLPGVSSRLLMGLWMSFVVLNCQVVEWVNIFANPVFKNPGIITLMIKENRALWLARSFASSRFNHLTVIITLKASSFQNGSKICWCFGVGNWSIILFSRIIINVIILKQLVASGDVNIDI